MSLPYARFVQIGRTIAEAMTDEVMDEYRLSAYVGWQNYLTQMMVWGGKKKPKSFKEWLVYLRLSEPDKPLTPEQEKEIERRAIAEAEDILKQFQAS
jgi:hypothetical protein